jgi:hypothetical protein
MGMIYVQGKLTFIQKMSEMRELSHILAQSVIKALHIYISTGCI